MIGRGKTWLATAGMCLLLAATASAASGAGFQTEILGTAHVQGTQVAENVFTLNNRMVRCKSLTWSGKAAGPSIGELSLAPEQSECTAWGLTATVSSNGCSYGFDVTGASEPFAGGWKVKCPPGQKIVIHAPGGCTAEIGEQTVPGGVDLSNEGSEKSRDVLLTATGEGMTATVTGSLLICGTNGVRTNGRYTGTMTLRAYSDPTQTSQAGLYVGEPQPLLPLQMELSGTTFLQASQQTENVLTINNRPFRCEKISWTGMASGSFTLAVSLSPVVSGCTMTGVGATVATNGCEYVLAAVATSPIKGRWAIVCPEGKAIVVTVSSACTIEIGQQVLPEGVQLTNGVAGSKGDVLITLTAAGIVSTVSGSASICGENGERKNGTFSGTLTMQGFADPGRTIQAGIAYF